MTHKAATEESRREARPQLGAPALGQTFWQGEAPMQQDSRVKARATQHLDVDSGGRAHASFYFRVRILTLVL
jgi:hypothetical protein